MSGRCGAKDERPVGRGSMRGAMDGPWSGHLCGSQVRPVEVLLGKVGQMNLSPCLKHSLSPWLVFSGSESSHKGGEYMTPCVEAAEVGKLLASSKLFSSIHVLQ